MFELAGDAGERPQAYKAAGLFMLTKIDLLIAIWDGEHAAGIGGTAQIVERALAVYPRRKDRSSKPQRNANVVAGGGQFADGQS